MTQIRRLIGVYHADGGLLGELRYVIGSLRGTAHCALCDITHGRLSAKAEWKSCAAGFGVPFETVHLNERSADLAAATDGSTPCVAAELDDSTFEILLDPHALERCKGNVDTFAAALTAAFEQRRNQ